MSTNKPLRPSSAPRPPPALLNHMRIQTTTVLGAGLLHIFTTPSTLHSICTQISRYLPFLPPTLPVLPSILQHHLLRQQQTLTGVILMGIGTVYAMSLWWEKWEYVYLSIPGRLVIAATGLGVGVARGGEAMGTLLALVALNDGLGAALGGWSTGAWLGVAEGEGEASKVE